MMMIGDWLDIFYNLHLSRLSITEQILILNFILFFVQHSLHTMKIEAKKNYTLKPRVVLPDSYVKGERFFIYYLIDGTI